MTTGKLAVAEGIETALAVTRMNPPWPCWATLSAGGLESVEIPPTLTEIAIMMDNGSNQVGQQAGKALARRLFQLPCPPVIKLLIPDQPDTDWLDVWGTKHHG